MKEKGSHFADKGQQDSSAIVIEQDKSLWTKAASLMESNKIRRIYHKFEMNEEKNTSNVSLRNSSVVVTILWYVWAWRVMRPADMSWQDSWLWLLLQDIRQGQ